MVMWKPTGRIRCLAARSTQLLVEALRRALYYSPLSFQPNSELNDFFGFFCLAVADKNGHDPSFFAKAFEPILRHVKWHHYTL